MNELLCSLNGYPIRYLYRFLASTFAWRTLRGLAGGDPRKSPKEAGLERGDHVLAIDLVGPSMALVKVKCQMPPRYFTDLLSFLKVDGKWVVSQKVFMTETQ